MMENLIDFDGSIEDLCAVQDKVSVNLSAQPDINTTQLIDYEVVKFDHNSRPLAPVDGPPTSEDSITSISPDRPVDPLDDRKDSCTYLHNIKLDSTSIQNVRQPIHLENDRTTNFEDTADLVRLCQKWENYLSTEITEAHLRDRVVFIDGYFSGNVLLQATLSNCFSTYEMWGSVFDYTTGRNIDKFTAKDDRSRCIMKRNNEISRLYNAHGAIRPEKFVGWVLNNAHNGIPMIVSSNMKDLFSSNGKKFLNLCVTTEPIKDAVCKCGKYAVAQKNDSFMCNEHSRNLDSYGEVLIYLPLLIDIHMSRSFTEVRCFNYPTQFTARRKIELPWSPETIRKWTTVKTASHPKPILDTSRCVREMSLHKLLHKSSKDSPKSTCFKSWESHGGTACSVLRTKCILRRLLSDVSHLTKGVVVIMSDGAAAKRVMDEAKTLHMAQGNFVWLWIDTGSSLTARNESKLSIFYPFPGDDRIKDRRARESGDHQGSERSTSSGDYFSYIIKYLMGESVTANSTDSNSSKSESDTSIEVLATPRETSVNITRINNKTATPLHETGFNDTKNSSNSQNYTNNEINKLDYNSTEESVSNKVINKLDRSRSKSSLRLSKNTTVTNDYVWISNRRGISVFPKDKVSRLVEHLPFPLHVFENSNASDSIDGLYSGNNESDSRLSGPRGARSVKAGDVPNAADVVPPLPVGVLGIRALPLRFDRHLVRSAVRLFVDALRRALHRNCQMDSQEAPQTLSCRNTTHEWQKNFSRYLVRELRTDPEQLNVSSDKIDRVLAPRFQILNLVPDSPQIVLEDFEMQEVQESTTWRPVGDMVGQHVHLDTVVWPGGDLVPVSTSRGVRSVFRVVTSLAPPFVMEGELDEDGQCLRGLECHRLLTSDKDNLTLVFNEMERLEDAEEDSELPERDIWAMGSIFQNSRYKYRTNCCYGLSMDLLENVAQELEFDFHLYIVADEAYGSRVVQSNGEIKWNGIVGDLVSGAAHMSFSALSVSSPRSQVIDFSVPYFFSGVSFLAAPRQRTDIPLLAFLLPFSPELWIAIFTSLNVTAVAVAIYEWLSPFGLNPWGRQRSKNFSMSSALWVCWGLLCGHLVAFKAPKSWPNKFLINVWGGFSVIFVASYTANIAALIAGLFFHNAVGDYHDRSLLSQRVGTPRASAADYYVHRANQVLWEHMQRYSVKDVATGVQHLKNGSLDILIADTPILDYYRATDHGCKLQKIGDAINEDTYAVGMTKGFPLKDSISAVIAKYSSNGYMDILQEKWYGGLPCFKLATDMAQPRPLGVAAVTGVFLLLGMGMIVGCLILLIEHLFYRYTLPILRHKPKGTIWRSRNIMFFSQKLYRFINCVELVSPHHAARELVHTLRQGQITSLFQKSVKRKEHEQRRRRRSKAQFFEMIQEIRRVQQEEKVVNATIPMLTLPEEKSPKSKKHPPSEQNRRHSRLDLARRLSKDVFRSKSSSNLSIRRLSSDINMAAGRFLDCHSSQAIGRRLSRDTNPSPPDINSRRASHLSISRKPSSQFLSPSDAESSSDVSATPRSPNLANTQSTSMRLLQTLPKSPDYASAASRFRYVDIKSPSFKTKLSRFKEPTQEDNPKVIIHHDNAESATPPTPPPRTTSQEHLIEIIIPPEEKPLPAERLMTPRDTLQPSRSLTGLSVLEQISSLEQTQNRPPPPTAPKPKIVSYLPKKHRKLSTDVSQRRVNGKTRKRASSDSILRADETKPEPRPDMGLVVENCDVFLPSESTPLSRLSRAELMTLSQIPEHELKRKLMEAIENRDPT